MIWANFRGAEHSSGAWVQLDSLRKSVTEAPTEALFSNNNCLAFLREVW